MCVFIAKIPNRGSQPTYLLRESSREGKKVRNRTLASLTHRPAQRREALGRALRGEFDHLARGRPVCGPSFGALYAVQAVADRLGVSRALGSSRRGQPALFLVLGRRLHQGSRLSAVRRARHQAVGEVLGLDSFTEGDLYRTWTNGPPAENGSRSTCTAGTSAAAGLSLPCSCCTTSPAPTWRAAATSGDGYSRDGERGKQQIVVGWLTDEAGEPPACRVFAGKRADRSTVGEQIRIVQEPFGVREAVFVGDQGMVKLAGKQALTAAGLRYIPAPTEPQVRHLLGEGSLQLGLFDEAVGEVEADGRRYTLRRNPLVAERERRRAEDKPAGLTARVAARNRFVESSQRARPEAGNGRIRQWLER